MKTLLLFRHAKSSRDDPELDDFDRPLAPRGVADAPAMGKLIAGRGWIPDHALVSPAARTTETWTLARRAFGRDVPAIYPQKLYLASAETLFEQIRKVPEAVTTLILVGHNPGLEDCAVALCGEGSDGRAAAELRRKFPTGALARFAHEGGWDEIRPGAAALLDFIRPRDTA